MNGAWKPPRKIFNSKPQITIKCMAIKKEYILF